MECGANFTASGERLYDCEVISSDPDVVSVNMKGTTSADITVHKSGTATLTIRSKYNPEAAESEYFCRNAGEPAVQYQTFPG